MNGCKSDDINCKRYVYGQETDPRSNETTGKTGKRLIDRHEDSLSHSTIEMEAISRVPSCRQHDATRGGAGPREWSTMGTITTISQIALSSMATRPHLTVRDAASGARAARPTGRATINDFCVERAGLCVVKVRAATARGAMEVLWEGARVGAAAQARRSIGADD